MKGRFVRNTSRITNSYLNKKEEDKTLGFYLDTCTPLGENSARLVIGSATEIALVAAREFIFASTEHRLIPYNDSFITYRQDKGIFKASIIAYRSGINEKPVKEAGNMVQISANTYLDQDIGEVWEKADIDGKPFFVKKDSEDIEKILQDVVYVTASANVRATSNTNDFIPAFAKEDWVEFFTLSKDGIPGKAIGLVAGVTENQKVKVKVGDLDGEVPVHAITRVVAGNEVNSIADVIKFLKKSYPKDYAKILKKIKK